MGKQKQLNPFSNSNIPFTVTGTQDHMVLNKKLKQVLWRRPETYFDITKFVSMFSVTSLFPTVFTCLHSVSKVVQRAIKKD